MNWYEKYMKGSRYSEHKENEKESSGPTHKPSESPSRLIPGTKAWYDFSYLLDGNKPKEVKTIFIPEDGDDDVPWYQQYSGYQGYRGNYQYQYKAYEEEEIMNGEVKISLERGDILVVPTGRMEDVPSKYRHVTIEMPYSFSCAVVRSC